MNLDDLIAEAEESVADSEETVEAVKEELQALQGARAEIARLRTVESAAKALLDQAAPYPVPGYFHDGFVALKKACAWTPPADDPWDRKPGRRYVATFGHDRDVPKGCLVEVVESIGLDRKIRNAVTREEILGSWRLMPGFGWRLPTAEDLAKLAPEGTLVTDFGSLRVGDVVRREAAGTIVKARIEILNHGSFWHKTEVLEGDPVLNVVNREDVTAGFVRLLSREPEGALVTDFGSLKKGDKVRIERKAGDQDPAGLIYSKLTVDAVLDTCRTSVSYGQWWSTETGGVLDICDVARGRVRLLSKRKPYVKDGRWVAEVGDRFRYVGTEYASWTSGDLVTVVCLSAQRNARSTVGTKVRRESGAEEIVGLYDGCWTPVEAGE